MFGNPASDIFFLSSSMDMLIGRCSTTSFSPFFSSDNEVTAALSP